MTETTPQPTGFLLINKPVDWTSHDVVGYLRGVTKIKKIGHAGTLDPFATGLLIVAIGRQSTKRIDKFKNMPKEYIAEVTLGATSNTQDLTGTIVPTSKDALQCVSESQITNILKTFTGEQQQIPPMFSAKKVKGKKLYELARKGIEIERQPNTITIHSIELLDFNEQKQIFSIKVSCSTGTYIRTLAHDIGQALKTGAYCSALERTKIGEYSVEDAVGPKELTRELFANRLINV